jgi:hypothetical protein
MSDETVASQATQGGVGAAVQDPAPSEGAKTGPQVQAGAVTDAQEDPQSPPSRDARGPADAAIKQEQTPEGSSQSAHDEAAGAAQRTAADRSAVAPGAAGTAVGARSSPFTERQIGAARKFGLAQEDLAALEAMGASGRGLLDRLVKADSELGRRFSRLGREEQTHGTKGPTLAVPQVTVASDQDTAAQRAAVAPQAAASPARPEVADQAQEVERLRAQVADLQREAQEAEARRQDLARQVRLRSEGLLARPVQRRGGGELESPADRTARALEEWQSRRGIQFFRS